MSAPRSSIAGPAGAPPSPALPPPRWRAASRSLVAHAAAHLLLLALVVGLAPEPSSFGSDDGAYGGQVHALLNGAWTLERPLPVVDEDNEGWLNTAITPDGPLPYVTNPSWVRALTTTVRAVAAVTGDDQPTRAADHPLALALLPVAGAVLSAVAAWLLAARLDRRARPLAFWLVALGPMLVNATTLWAHTVAGAAAGLAATGLADLVGRPPEEEPGWRGQARAMLTPAVLGATALAVVAAVATAVVRTESVFWIASLALAAVAIDRRPVVVLPAGAMAGASALAYLVNRGWGAGLRAGELPVTTSVVELSGSPGWLASRLPAAWQLLAAGGSEPAVLLVVAAMTLVAYGALRLRGDDPTPPSGAAAAAATNPSPGPGPAPAATLGPRLLAAAALLHGLFALVGGSATISGLVAAWPAGLVLLVAGHHRPDPRARFLALACGLLTVMVVLTQYPLSGGHQWGGRYLSMALAPLAALAAAAGFRVWERHRRRLLALMLLPAAAGIATSHRLHQVHHEVIAALTERGSEVVVTENAAVPRLAWTALPTAFYRADADSLEPLLAELAAAGVGTVTVHGVQDAAIGPASGYRVATTDGSLRHLERLDAGPAG